MTIKPSSRCSGSAKSSRGVRCSSCVLSICHAAALRAHVHIHACELWPCNVRSNFGQSELGLFVSHVQFSSRSPFEGQKPPPLQEKVLTLAHPPQTVPGPRQSRSKFIQCRGPSRLQSWSKVGPFVSKIVQSRPTLAHPKPAPSVHAGQYPNLSNY